MPLLSGMTATNDPTMRLIESLDNPALFERKEHVAVFKPHERDFPAVKMADGKTVAAQTVKVTDKDLETIAANVNKHYSEDGQLVKLVIGHRKYDPAHPETGQPPVVGYARNYKAEVVKRPGGDAIRLTHTEYIHRDKPQSASVLRGEYPERSPEYDPERKLITGVALLTRDQALPLGTVSYDAAERRFLYAMEPEAMSAASNDDDMNDDDKKFYALFEKCMKKYSASAPGPANAATPAAATAQYSADPIHAKLLVEIERQKEATAAAQREAVLARCRNWLEPMRDIRKFNYERELETLVSFADEDARGRHVSYMLDNYLPLPTGGMIRTAPTEFPKPRTDEDNKPSFAKQPKGHGAACQYMSDNPGVQYEDALKKVNQA